MPLFGPLIGKCVSTYVTVSNSIATGVTQPLTIADATIPIATLPPEGRVDDPGHVGAVAAIFQFVVTEQGVGAGQAGLGAGAIAGYPYPVTQGYAGQNGATCVLRRKDGSDLLLSDVLSTAPGTVDADARVYGYLAYRGDLAANLHWRLWFYYRRQSDGLETPFVPDTSYPNAELAIPAVYITTTIPTRSGLGVPIVAGEAAAVIGPGATPNPGGVAGFMPAADRTATNQLITVRHVTFADTPVTLTNAQGTCGTDSFNGPILVNLPAAPVFEGQTHVIPDETGTAGAHNITVSGNGNLIDGQLTFVLNAAWQSLTVRWMGATGWKVI